jgi:hypothetical protein
LIKAIDAVRDNGTNLPASDLFSSPKLVAAADHDDYLCIFDGTHI